MWVQSSSVQQHWGEAPHLGIHTRTHSHSLLRPWLTSSHWGGLDARSPWVDHVECSPRECVKAPSPRRDTCLLEAPAPATVQPGAARRAPRALPAARRACLLPARPPRLSSPHCPHTHGQKQRTSDIADTAASTDTAELATLEEWSWDLTRSPRSML